MKTPLSWSSAWIRVWMLGAGCAVGLSVGLWTDAAPAEEASDSEEVRACMERTLPTRTSIQRIELETADEGGSIDRARATIHWKRAEDGLISVLMRFSEPPRRAGLGMLARQQAEGSPETFLYLPELRTTRRVSARSAAGSMFGTDFSYEDFAFLQGVTSDEAPKILEEQQVGERAAYVLESRVSLDDDPTYERILYYVEKEHCSPLRVEFYEPGGRLRKVLEVDADSIEAHGERFIPMRTTMRDLELGSYTAVKVLSIKPDAEIKDKFFSPSQLEWKGR